MLGPFESGYHGKEYVWPSRGDMALGLKAAYRSPDATHVKNGVLYVAGTSSVADIIKDVGLARGVLGGNNTEEVLSLPDRRWNYVSLPKFDAVVGHSLGGVYANRIAERHAKPVLTFGSPVGPTTLNKYDPLRFVRWALGDPATTIPGQGMLHGVPSYLQEGSPPSLRGTQREELR